MRDDAQVGRRGLLRLAAGAGAVLASVVGLRAVARGRPRPHGSSATRCALCGSPDHSMLSCPQAPKVT